MKRILLKQLVIIAMLSASGAACAQYVWINERGVKEYSDIPPPASIPKNHILKTPRMAARTLSQAAEAEAQASADASAAASAASAASAPKDKPPMTTAEKNADFQKRKAEQAEKDKKAADEAKLAADKAKNCEQAKSYNRSLQAGERLTRTDKNGERYYLNDEQRAQEARDTKRILDECK